MNQNSFHKMKPKMCFTVLIILASVSPIITSDENDKKLQMKQMKIEESSVDSKIISSQDKLQNEAKAKSLSEINNAVKEDEKVANSYKEEKDGEIAEELPKPEAFIWHRTHRPQTRLFSMPGVPRFRRPMVLSPYEARKQENERRKRYEMEYMASRRRPQFYRRHRTLKPKHQQQYFVDDLHFREEEQFFEKGPPRFKHHHNDEPPRFNLHHDNEPPRFKPYIDNEPPRFKPYNDNEPPRFKLHNDDVPPRFKLHNEDIPLRFSPYRISDEGYFEDPYFEDEHGFDFEAKEPHPPFDNHRHRNLPQSYPPRLSHPSPPPPPHSPPHNRPPLVTSPSDTQHRQYPTVNYNVQMPNTVGGLFKMLNPLNYIFPNRNSPSSHPPPPPPPLSPPSPPPLPRDRPLSPLRRPPRQNSPIDYEREPISYSRPSPSSPPTKYRNNRPRPIDAEPFDLDEAYQQDDANYQKNNYNSNDDSVNIPVFTNDLQNKKTVSSFNDEDIPSFAPDIPINYDPRKRPEKSNHNSLDFRPPSSNYVQSNIKYHSSNVQDSSLATQGDQELPKEILRSIAQRDDLYIGKDGNIYVKDKNSRNDDLFGLDMYGMKYPDEIAKTSNNRRFSGNPYRRYPPYSSIRRKSYRNYRSLKGPRKVQDPRTEDFYPGDGFFKADFKTLVKMQPSKHNRLVTLS